MIVCPNCEHQNPDGALACEACYTPLPMMTECPNCGASVQTDASFCGQCGFNLQENPSAEETPLEPSVAPTVVPDPVTESSSPSQVPETLPISSQPTPAEIPEAPAGVPEAPAGVPEAPAGIPEASTPVRVAFPSQGSATQLQVPQIRLLHVQTDTLIDLPSHPNVIHIGKPNSRIPPDIDVSGFPNSEVVSRVHADIRVEAGTYYLEDVGSSNGTYVNHVPLPPGNRHRLRAGDRIALGKGDLMTFLFQMP
ncbi:MAG: FHA domain-containing protein [Cyanobacteriota bacterium]|nr:FHA domain-containing protein [Cyanobacteriota bacterium]